MNSETLSRFRRSLEEQLAELESATRAHEDRLGESRTTDDFTGPDRASDLEALAVDAVVTESERRLAITVEGEGAGAERLASIVGELQEIR